MHGRVSGCLGGCVDHTMSDARSPMRTSHDSADDAGCDAEGGGAAQRSYDVRLVIASSCAEYVALR